MHRLSPGGSSVSNQAKERTSFVFMRRHIYSSIRVHLRLSRVLISGLFLLAASVGVAAQQPSISVQDAQVVEGNVGTTDMTFVVALSAASSQTVTCTFATANGTAIAGSDYVAISGALSFAPGETQKQVVVKINGDTVDETQETLFLDISNVVNATVQTSRGTGFIVDDDGPTISINDVSILEGNSGTKTATFTLTLSAASVEPIAVRAITADGTATAPGDYTSTNTVVTFQPGVVTHTVDVTIIGDTILEQNETFFVNLSEPFGTTIAKGQGVGTILDDDHLLALEESGPAAQQAGAVESIFLTRDAFKVENVFSWFNLQPGQNTLVMIFAENLRLNSGETSANVVVHLVDGNGSIFDVPANDVRQVANTDLAQVVFTLPDALAQGTCNVSVKAHGQSSNTGTIRIAAP